MRWTRHGISFLAVIATSLLCLACGPPVCGDKEVEGEEACDKGRADSAACNGASAGEIGCQAARCGDGYTNTAAGEECDVAGDDEAACNGSAAGDVGCHTPECGDGHLNTAAGEECDDGNIMDGDSCTSTCETFVAAPKLVLEPAAVDFGRVRVGETATVALTLGNQGNAALHLSAISVSGAAFAARAGEIHLVATPAMLDDPDADGSPGLAAGAAVPFEVVYTPSSDDSDVGELVLESDDPAQPRSTVTLKGNDTPCMVLSSPDSDGSALAFGPAPGDRVSTADLIISSCGPLPLTISLMGYTEGSDPRFRLVDAESYGYPLILAPVAPDGSMDSITVQLSYMFSTRLTGEGMFAVENDDPRCDPACGVPVLSRGWSNSCPRAEIAEDTLEARTFEVVTLDGSPSTDHNAGEGVGELVGYRWQILNSPEGSTATLIESLANPDSPRDGGPEDDESTPTALFVPDVMGQYWFSLAVYDDLGALSASPQCGGGEPQARLTVRPGGKIRVLLEWDGLHESAVEEDLLTDVDLHILHPSGDFWGEAPADCHHANPAPDWGPEGDVGNPVFVDGGVGAGGSETFTLDPEEDQQIDPGVYVVGLHYAAAAVPNPEDIQHMNPARLEVWIDGELQVSWRSAFTEPDQFVEAALIFWEDGPGAVEVDMWHDGIPAEPARQ